MIFPTFLHLSLNLAIRGSCHSQSCFCWLYRASPPLAARNISTQISVLTIWWWPCVESSLVLLGEGVCYDLYVLLANSVSLCPALFCTPRPNLPVTPGISWIPTFAFQSPVMKGTSFLVLVLEGLVGLHGTIQIQLLQHSLSPVLLFLCWLVTVCFVLWVWLLAKLLNFNIFISNQMLVWYHSLGWVWHFRLLPFNWVGVNI